MNYKTLRDTIQDIVEAATFGNPSYKATDFTMNQKTVDRVIKELRRCVEHLDPGHDMADVVLQDINKLIKTLSGGRESSTVLVKELRRITKYLDPGYDMADAALQDINKLIKTLESRKPQGTL